MSQPTGNPKGRPSRYNAQIAAAICWRISEGELLIDIADETDMPHRGTIYRWVEDIPSFRDMYARARTMQGHSSAERAVRTARNSKPENAADARIKFDAERWFAAKLLPKVYGDKLLHTGADGEGPVAVKLALDYSLLAPDELLTLRRLLLKATPAPAAAPLQIEGEVIEDDEK